jgi:hypothetical protein
MSRDKKPKILAARSANITGLCLVTLAAVIMWFYPPEMTVVTDRGEPVVNFTGRTTPEAMKMARMQWYLRRIGPTLLVIGFALQLSAALRRRGEVSQRGRPEMSDAQDIDPKRDRKERFARLTKPFRAHSALYDVVNQLLDEHEIKLPKDDAYRDLALVIGAAFGKALKTYYAIHELCLMGFGEYAVVLLRSNVNLLINIAYILGDAEHRERVLDFIAASHVARVKYLKTAHPTSRNRRGRSLCRTTIWRPERRDGTRRTSPHAPKGSTRCTTCRVTGSTPASSTPTRWR